MRRAWTSAAIGVAVLGAIMVVFQLWPRGDLVEVEKEVGLRGEAAGNPWLAMERFLATMGVPTEGRTTLLELPPSDTLLVLVAPRTALGPDRTRKLLTWVETGGKLLVATLEPKSTRIPTRLGRPRRPDPESDGSRHDLLLDALGITVQDRDPSPSPTVLRFLQPKKEFTVAHADRTLDSQGTDEVLWSCETTRQSGGTGVFALELARERGSVTVIADKTPFENLALGKNDHAEFLWELLSRSGLPTRAWVIRSDEPPGLWAQVVGLAWPLLIGLALLVTLFLWRASRRFGPIRDRHDSPRRSLVEHLLAAGRFTWQSGRSDILLAALRSSLSSRINRRHPELASASEARRRELLSAWSDLPADRVDAALKATPRSNQERVLALVRDLERIHSHT